MGSVKSCFCHQFQISHVDESPNFCSRAHRTSVHEPPTKWAVSYSVVELRARPNSPIPAATPPSERTPCPPRRILQGQVARGVNTREVPNGWHLQIIRLAYLS